MALLWLTVAAGLLAAAVFTPWFVGVRRGRAPCTDIRAPPPWKFPPEFAWGVAVAAQQVEWQQASDWTAFELDATAHGRTGTDPRPGYALPGHIHDLDRYPVEVRRRKVDFDRRFESDFSELAGLGLNAYRFSICWARLFPREDMSDPDPAGIDFYRRVITALKANGMMPFATLFHFSSPQWLWRERDGKRGFERPDALQHWRRFVTAVSAAFGDEISDWCTLNEPMVYVFNGYIEGVFPPNERRAGGPAAVAPLVSRLLEAHAIAYRILHADAARRGREIRVGVAQHARAFEPWRNWALTDRLGAAFVRQAFIWDFLDAIASGSYAMTRSAYRARIEDLAGSQDYIGINYYGRYYVESRLSAPGEPVIHFNDPLDPREIRGDLGWAVYPRGFGDVLREAKRRYGKPVYVLENGIADADADDRRRQFLLLSHLREIWAARNEGGVDVRGYFHWSQLDNFEWAEGFEARFGLYRVDYDTDFARSARPSAGLYRDIIANGLSRELWQRYRPGR